MSNKRHAAPDALESMSSKTNRTHAGGSRAQVDNWRGVTRAKPWELRISIQITVSCASPLLLDLND